MMGVKDTTFCGPRLHILTLSYIFNVRMCVGKEAFLNFSAGLMLLVWIIIVICVFIYSDNAIYTTKQLYYIPVYLYYKATNRPKLSSWARITTYSISCGEDWVVKQQTQPLPQMVMFGCLMTMVVKYWSTMLSSWTVTQHFDIPVTLLYIHKYKNDFVEIKTM